MELPTSKQRRRPRPVPVPYDPRDCSPPSQSLHALSISNISYTPWRSYAQPCSRDWIQREYCFQWRQGKAETRKLGPETNRHRIASLLSVLRRTGVGSVIENVLGSVDVPAASDLQLHSTHEAILPLIPTIRYQTPLLCRHHKYLTPIGAPSRSPIDEGKHRFKQPRKQAFHSQHCLSSQVR